MLCKKFFWNAVGRRRKDNFGTLRRKINFTKLTRVSCFNDFVGKLKAFSIPVLFVPLHFPMSRPLSKPSFLKHTTIQIAGIFKYLPRRH